MKLYEKNREALSKRQIHKKITAYCTEHQPEDMTDAVSSVEILQAEDGEAVVRYSSDKQYFLDSIYNPAHAAGHFLKPYMEIPDRAGLFLFGLAGGEYVRAFLDKAPNQVFCVVYEPCKEIFLKLMAEIDISDILSNSDFYLVVHGINDGDFERFLNIKNNYASRYQNQYAALPRYRELFPREWKGFHDIVLKNENNFQLMINTLVLMGKRMCYTAIQNMRYLPGCRVGRDYVQRFPEEMPAIVVAAGPSLEKNVDLLHKAKGRALIIVVDSALRTVYKRGIQPDMAITVDCRKELKNFEVEGLGDTFLVTDMVANTDALDKIKPRNLIFDSSDSPIWNRLFKEEGTEIQELYSGGSVALVAMSYAISLGFKKIILIGQDLAMTGGKQYADGTEKVNEHDFEGTKWVKDIYGNDVLTKPDYYTFIQNIEMIGYLCSDIEIIDATEGGAFKKNTTIMTLQEALDKYCKKEYPVREILESVPRRFTKGGVQKILDTLEAMKEHLKDIQERTESGTEKCKRASEMLKNKEYNKEELSEINQYISELDELYVNMEEHTLIERVIAYSDYKFVSSIYKTENEDIAEAIRLYENSERYYRGIADAAPEIISMIDECIDKMKKQTYTYTE